MFEEIDPKLDRDIGLHQYLKILLRITSTSVNLELVNIKNKLESFCLKNMNQS